MADRRDPFPTEEGRLALLLMAPAGVVVLGLAIYPIVDVLWLSLHRKMLIFDISGFVGLENYARLLGDARFWNSFLKMPYFLLELNNRRLANFNYEKLCLYILLSCT